MKRKNSEVGKLVPGREEPANVIKAVGPRSRKDGCLRTTETAPLLQSYSNHQDVP